MDNLQKIKELLSEFKVPKRQQSDLCAHTLLAMARIKKTSSWSNATNEWIRIHDIIKFISHHYEKHYAENSRETIRKQAIHHFRTAAFIEDNGKATNSPDYKYRLTAEFLKVIKTGGSKKTKASFLAKHQSLVSLYVSKKKMRQIPVTINGQTLSFSTGAHNQLQKAIIEDFGPRFAPGAMCLYVGDTTKKDLVKNEIELKRLGFEISLHDKMPDVVLYSKKNNWLYFIESVTSVGPMNAKRILELKKMTNKVIIGKIFVTAFPNFKTFKKFSEDLAWETEVWIADMPDHMIHLNGDKFLGPR